MLLLTISFIAELGDWFFIWHKSLNLVVKSSLQITTKSRWKDPHNLEFNDIFGNFRMDDTLVEKISPHEYLMKNH